MFQNQPPALLHGSATEKAKTSAAELTSENYKCTCSFKCITNLLDCMFLSCQVRFSE